MRESITSDAAPEGVGVHAQKFSDAVREGTAVDSTMPTPEEVGARAKRIYEAFRADPEFRAFKAATLAHLTRWQCFGGPVLVSNWDLVLDRESLFREAVRALVLKSAVCELTGGDERAAEIAISDPVDEMVHASLAQQQVLERICTRQEFQVIHQTDQESNDYREGDYTSKCYYVAFGRQPVARFWLDAEVVASRKQELAALFKTIGIRDLGEKHDIVFADTVAA
ncbi:hypothetical protein [Streptomyces sp. NPDC059761]|uniref:hypothetical protein n=1 Tax=Streptomyces sp. NPDC059761 TaxID=3346937 RepID=UPI00365C75F2